MVSGLAGIDPPTTFAYDFCSPTTCGPSRSRIARGSPPDFLMESRALSALSGEAGTSGRRSRIKTSDPTAPCRNRFRSPSSPDGRVGLGVSRIRLALSHLPAGPAHARDQKSWDARLESRANPSRHEFGQVPAECQGRSKTRPSGRWPECLKVAGRAEASGRWGGSVFAGVLTVCEAIAVAVQFQDVDVMGQPIEQRAGESFGAEDLGPFIVGQIRGHQR